MNLDKLLDDAIEKTQKLATAWLSSDLENKRIMQEILFPDGIYYNAEKHEYRTLKTNSFIELIGRLAQVSEEKEKGNLQQFVENSLSVARKGELSNLLLQDLIKFCLLN